MGANSGRRNRIKLLQRRPVQLLPFPRKWSFIQFEPRKEHGIQNRERLQCQQFFQDFKQVYVLPRSIPQRLSDQYSLCTSCKDRRRNTMADRSSGICQNYDIPNSGRRHRLCNPQRSRLCDSAATAIVDIPPRPYLCRLPYDASKLHPDGWRSHDRATHWDSRSTRSIHLLFFSW